MHLRFLPTCAALAAAIALLITACSSDGDATPTPGGGSPPPSATQSPAATAASPTVAPGAPAGALTSGSIRLEPALDGRVFDRPVEFGAYPPGSDAGAGADVYVVEQDGVVLGFHAGEETTRLDLRARVSRGGNEQGLLSFALDPTFADSGHVWLYYSVAGGERRTQLARFTADRAGTGVIDPASELVVLEQAQPYPNHNGGAIRFGPDGMLYLGLGDGGAADDPQGNGQNLETLLGSVIRIDVRNATTAAPYMVPADNPFVATSGARPEIWAYGVRNPWRMSFDPETGELWLADVGQNAWEEVDVVVRGGNYGWNTTEGRECFSPRSGCDRAGLTDPVAAYSHDDGCSISGGFVYRGDAVPALRGHYVYADYCSGTLWALDVAARGEPIVLGQVAGRVAGFGIDAAGELYALVFGGPVLRLVAS
ncbi:MAG: PQQ-dependent sugar dehydrogenase [Chloroflexi bacterium]|nr:PQQ-dependent sugar dehydrogenase [Chloroflexota bacterium]